MKGRSLAAVLAMLATGWTSAGPQEGTRFETEEGTGRARYLVREQLLGRDLPNDAVGETDEITGSLVLDDEGRVVGEESLIRVRTGSLRTDVDMRDNYVRRRVLLTEEHPETTLRVTAIDGLPWPLPESGSRPLELTGDLTVIGVTRPTTWTVDATFSPGRVTGTARTAFTFDDFGIRRPQVRRVLSVADTIRLEYDFSFVTTGEGSLASGGRQLGSTAPA